MDNKTFLEKLSIGCGAIDKLLGGGLEKGIITTVFGEAGSGKTNFALQAAVSCIKRNGKVVFIDTEGGFSIERFLQMAPRKELAKIIIFEPKDFSEQSAVIPIAVAMAKKKAELVILDSAVALYRLEMCDEKAQQVNKQLAYQLGLLSGVAREKKIPIIITDQVYSSFKSRTTCAVGGDVLKYVSKCIIKLEKLRGAKRRAVLVKHRSIAEGKIAEFEIRNEGLVDTKKFKLFENK